MFEMCRTLRPLSILFLTFLLAGLTISETRAESTAFYVSRAVQNYERNWNRLQTEGPWEKFSVRLPAEYLYVMTAAEVYFRENPDERGSYPIIPLDRAEDLLELVRAMQDLTPDSPTFGNFRWYWFQSTVEDRNAVEFVLQRLLFCRKHAEIFPLEIQRKIDEILRDACPGLLNHTVRPDYTNISVLNFANLLLLGEALDLPEAWEEGRRRMNGFLYWTWSRGIREFSSPTYIAVTLEAFEVLESLVTDSQVKLEARAMMDFLAMDICAHFHPGVGRYVGPWSRTYNYLHGDLYLGFHLQRWGWLPLPERSSNITILTALMSDYSSKKPEFSKNVRLRWDELMWNFTTTYSTEAYALGTSGSAYSSQDVLLSMDFCANPTTRAFYMMEARNDPYGTVRERTGGGHDKSLHLLHAWRATQRENEALAVSVFPKAELLKYRDKNAPIRSHFVFPKPDSWQLAPDFRTLKLHYGPTAATICAIWGNFAASDPAVFDDCPDASALRWTFEHGTSAECLKSGRFPAIAFYVKIATENDLQLSSVTVRESGDCALETSDGKLALKFPELENLQELTNDASTFMTPAPPEDILEVEGENVGRPFLERRIPSLQKYIADRAKWYEAPAQEVAGDSSTIASESALAFPGFREADGSVRVQNTVRWRFRVLEAGKYELRATVWAPDPRHDSLRVRLLPADPAVSPEFYPYWALGSSHSWREVRFTDTTFDLAAGVFELELSPREYDVRVQEIRWVRVR